jgi:hypothetical protein
VTIYHLRGTDGNEVFTGTITPPPGGGSQPVKIVRIPFVFNTTNLVLTGISLYAPSVGDILDINESYVSVRQAWDGSTPSLTFYSGVNTNGIGAPNIIDLTSDDASSAIDGNGDVVGAYGNIALVQGGSFPEAPWRFTTTNPFGMFVSDGTGGDPGSSQGIGEIILVIIPAP